MGYSIGFIRSFLALLGLIAVVAVVLGGVNELFDLGLFEAGYPVFGDADGDYGSYAVQCGVLFAVTTGLSLALERRDR